MATKTSKTTNGEKKIKIKLPLTREKQDDVYVGVDGRRFYIQRGVEVEVPEPVYEVLMNSAEMDRIALESIRQNASR